MKILLTTLNSKYIHSNLALRCIYGACPPQLRELTDVREFTINNTDDMIFIELMRSECEIMAFSCYIWNIEKTLRIIKQLKSARPELKIILGGPEVSFDTEILLKEYPFLDFIISGEGEKIMPALLKSILDCDFARAAEAENGSESELLPWGSIPGISYRIDDFSIKINPPAELIDFNESPFPYENMPLPSDKVVYYESSRGCPFNCSYCLSSVNRTVRPLSLDRVKREIAFFTENHVKQVKFIDRTFNYDRKRCFDLLEYIIEKDNGEINFHFEMCADLLDEKTIELLRGARRGLFQLEIGVQSTSPAVLAACSRSSDFEKAGELIKRLIERGNIHIHLDLIAGLPLETFDMFAKSFNEVFSLRPQALQIGFLKLLKGSPIRLEAEKYGYVFRSTPPYEVISNNYIKPEQLVKLKMIETVFELWYGRGGFSQTLEILIRQYDSSFSFFDELAEYYYANNFQERSHKKEDLYRIIWHFALEKISKNAASNPEFSEHSVKASLESDMESCLNFDAVKKFKKKGWEIQHG